MRSQDVLVVIGV